jgi:hypothetical protein
MRATPVLGRTLVFLLPTLFIAGCLDEAKVEAVDPELVPHGHDEDMAMHTGFSMEASECEEGGFIAAYGGEREYPGGWKSADITEEIGNPIHDSIGAPVTGPLNGNWHMGFRCKSASVDGIVQKDYIFGRVGQMIEAPAFDPGGADLHFITTGWAMGNGTIADSLRHVTTADITHAYNTHVEWYAPKDLPRSAAYALFCDVEKGVYEGMGDMEFYRDFPARTIRFWWIVPADGSAAHGSDHHGGVASTGPMPADAPLKYNPVYWDLTTTGGEQYTTPPSGVQFGFHNRGLEGMQEHGVPTQPTLTNVYEHESLTLTWGEVIEDVTIDEVWTH